MEGQAQAPQASGEAAPPAASTSWTSGLSEDSRGYVENKGFKDPGMVIDSYRNLEKLIGAPKERLLHLPEKEDAPEWGDIYNRLGRPQKADEYKFDVPKELGGDDKFANWAKSNFHELGLSRKQAEGLAGRWNQYMQNTASENAQQTTAQLQQEENTLKKEWGMAYDQNLNLAKRAVQSFGMDADTVEKLEGALGYQGVLKFMHSLGAKLGEDNFVSGGSSNQSGFGVLSPAAALSRIKDLRGDSDFVRRYTAGETAAKEEMFKLHKFAYPDND